jgi:hypothetical protein
MQCLVIEQDSLGYVIVMLAPVSIMNGFSSGVKLVTVGASAEKQATNSRRRVIPQSGRTGEDGSKTTTSAAAFVTEVELVTLETAVDGADADGEKLSWKRSSAARRAEITTGNSMTK